MSEEGTDAQNQEHELWEEVERTSGADRARALTALGRIYWERSKYKESLGYVEAARDLFLEAGREQYIEELTDVNFGIMNNLDMLDRSKDAAEAAGEVIALYRETDHPMLGELLRDQGRYWFAAGEYEKSIAAQADRSVARQRADVTKFGQEGVLLAVTTEVGVGAGRIAQPRGAAAPRSKASR
jgi:tetratricopeptide (TPR) repeat protein